MTENEESEFDKTQKAKKQEAGQWTPEEIDFSKESGTMQYKDNSQKKYPEIDDSLKFQLQTQKKPTSRLEKIAFISAGIVGLGAIGLNYWASQPIKPRKTKPKQEIVSRIPALTPTRTTTATPKPTPTQTPTPNYEQFRTFSSALLANAHKKYKGLLEKIERVNKFSRELEGQYDANIRDMEVQKEHQIEVVLGDYLQIFGERFVPQTLRENKKTSNSLEFSLTAEKNLKTIKDKNEIYFEGETFTYHPIERMENGKWKEDTDGNIEEYTVWTDKQFTRRNRGKITLPKYSKDLLLDKEDSEKGELEYYLIPNKDVIIMEDGSAPTHILIPKPAKEICDNTTGKTGVRGKLYISIQKNN